MTDKERTRLYFENAESLKIHQGEELWQTWCGSGEVMPRFAATKKAATGMFTLYKVSGKSLTKIMSSDSPYAFDRYIADHKGLV